MAMKTTDLGILEIAEHEGLVPAPYLDSQDVWTFGIGHTNGAGEPYPAAMTRGMPRDMDAAILYAVKVFRDDLEKYEERVNEAINVWLAPYQFDALVSFDFNTGGIYRAKLTKAINAGEIDAAEHFMGWTRPPEIRKRRLAEQALYRTGDYSANGDTITVWKVNEAGDLRGLHGTMSGTDLLRRMRG